MKSFGVKLVYKKFLYNPIWIISSQWQGREYHHMEKDKRNSEKTEFGCEIYLENETTDVLAAKKIYEKNLAIYLLYICNSPCIRTIWYYDTQKYKVGPLFSEFYKLLSVIDVSQLKVFVRWHIYHSEIWWDYVRLLSQIIPT